MKFENKTSTQRPVRNKISTVKKKPQKLLQAKKKKKTGKSELYQQGPAKNTR